MQALRAGDPAELGGYLLLARLGAGGMGQVYLALTGGGRHIAIKVVRDDFEGPQALARFRREVATVQAIRSPHTAALVGAGLDEPPYWLATEYIPGPTLAQAVAAQGAFSPRAGLRLLAALAEAVADVHARGIEHRDLKPQNVILAKDGPKLIDFGIARGDDQTAITRTGTMAGTPGYLAPEVVLRGETGRAMDVFALAGTVAFACTGRPPFGGGDAQAVVYRSIHQEMDLEGLDPQLTALLRGAAHKDPRMRPTATELLERCRVSGALTDEDDYRRLHSIAPAPPASAEEAVATGLLPSGRYRARRPRAAVVATVVGVVAVVLTLSFTARSLMRDSEGRSGGAGGTSTGAGPSGGRPSGSAGSVEGRNTDPSPGVSPSVVNNKIAGAPDDLYWSPKTRTCQPSVPVVERVPMRLEVAPPTGKVTGPSTKIKFWVTGGGVPDPPYYLAAAVYPALPATGWDESQLSKPFALPKQGWERTLEYPRDFQSKYHETWPLNSGEWVVLTYHVHSNGTAVLIDCTGFEVA
ncbi:serine/threonine-protein kinase [Actinomadura chibensis]|uniref:non-specific serine/threonine protein kinase n=1 Tax=Actinomadura chibensis TaxID=392828 RepID=A0A5D0NW67_9ACTN|nr:serine/threonine-protein kinase [Actinomadura chibensis]TYB48685.1 serine/threonine protein kinase [Actinomadura chibensis]